MIFWNLGFLVSLLCYSITMSEVAQKSTVPFGGSKQWISSSLKHNNNNNNNNMNKYLYSAHTCIKKTLMALNSKYKKIN